MQETFVDKFVKLCKNECKFFSFKLNKCSCNQLDIEFNFQIFKGNKIIQRAIFLTVYVCNLEKVNKH